MPTYDYVCQDCGAPFEVRASMAEYSQGLEPRCPHCGSRKAIRTFTSVSVFTGRRAGGSGACGPAAGPGCCG
jgi:putative FmdB family regulatory protein